MKKYVYLFVLLTGLSACDQKGSLESTKERARAEEEAGRDVENSKAREMEAELTKRERFLEVVSGTYKGTMKTKTREFAVKAVLEPSLPIYHGSRVRTPDEIAHDFANLHLNVLIVHWKATDPEETGIGCPPKVAKPDLETGQVTVTSEDCTVLYKLSLGDQPTSASSPGTVKAQSQSIASKILSGALDRVEALTIKMQSTSIATEYTFTVKRVNQ